MKIPRKKIITVIESISMGAKKATIILDSKTKVTATKVHDRSILLTLGRLNYEEKKIVKVAKAANKSFRHLRIKWPTRTKK